MVINNYRLISLLLTLGKVLKLLVVERIIYLVEEYSLLLKIYFRAKK